MTKQHFEAIAKILQNYHDSNYKSTETYHVIDELIGDFSSYLRTTNPNFDTIRFLKACGIGK